MKSIRTLLLALPEVATWPAMAEIIEKMTAKSLPIWDLPRAACQAVGGHTPLVTAAAAAIACQQISLVLVDDILKADPRGELGRIGEEEASALALAFQAAAIRVLAETAVPPDRLTKVTATLAWLALGTAYGHYQDVQKLADEENYWRVVRTKSCPFYGGALQVGALLGGATLEVATDLRDFGLLLGEIIRIYDDLADAFEAPASPNWRQRHKNLAILYAATAEHPHRTQFLALLPQIDDPLALQDAQQILIRCGAISYCLYHLIQRHRLAKQKLAQISLADPEPISDLLASRTQPIIGLLEAGGASLQAELLSELSI